VRVQAVAEATRPEQAAAPGPRLVAPGQDQQQVNAARAAGAMQAAMCRHLRQHSPATVPLMLLWWPSSAAGHSSLQGERCSLWHT
jgi:hypothetical protein